MIHSGTVKIFKIVLVVLVTLVILVGTSFFIIGYFKPKPGGIYVDTNPGSGVYINNIFVGKTPLKTSQKAGVITLKLVPMVTDQNLLPFETKITLIAGIETVVRREFGQTEESSSGDIISFESKAGGSSSLVVISTPENAQISLDGVPRGFAPYKTETISPAEHQITVRAPGYIDRVMTVNTKAGYRLTLFAKLAKNTEVVGPTPTPAPTIQSFVTILTTPTGYLRVRTEPGTKGEEIGQVKPGDKFPYLDTDAQSGWYKIQFEAPTAGLPNGITGWISNQFSSIASQSATLNAPSGP